jgi:serine/threonine protein kinase/tetratricopeptide (TPR) repeat protein
VRVPECPAFRFRNAGRPPGTVDSALGARADSRGKRDVYSGAANPVCHPLIMGLASGVRLGSYEIVAPLGAGGMGEVYRARDLKLERAVAVKVLPAHLSQSAEALARFEREAKAVAALAHPNILAIYDYGEDQGVAYAVTELLEGETLRERLRSARLLVPKATDLALQIARGLAAAHDKGIVHRDLKPENVFVTSDGRLKVLDFGLAKVDPGGYEDEGETPSPHTSAGMVMGTPGYMSPEQARGQAADHRTDIFSLGAVLYEMLSGERAFPGESVADALSAVLTRNPPELGSLAVSVPPSLERIVTRCLEKAPGERFQSARDLAFALEDVGTAESRSPRPEARRLPSVAVLPFANMSPDREQDYFCEGMAEDIINALTRVEGLRVVARASSFQFTGRALDLAQVGRTLGVDKILEGSVRTSGSRLRVTAQLIDVGDSSQVWSERYDRQMEDVFAIQDEISGSIVDALRVRLVGKGGSGRRHTDDVEAYHLYLKGQHNWYRRESDSLQRAASFFGEAAARDPGYALAHVGLANAYSSLGYYGMEPERAREKAGAAVDRALILDEGLPEAYAARGLMQMWLLWDWSGSQDSFERAIRGNPEDVLAHCWYGFLLDSTGRHRQALEMAERALALDPLSPYANTCVGLSLHTQGRNDEAIPALDRALEMDPDFLYTLWVLAWAYSEGGRHDDAVSVLERAVTLSGRAPYYLTCLALVCGRAGRGEPAETIVEELTRRSQSEYISPTFLAWAHAGMGDTARALDWLEQACEGRNPPLVMHQETLLRSLHGEERFRAVREQMGLDP